MVATSTWYGRPLASVPFTSCQAGQSGTVLRTCCWVQISSHSHRPVSLRATAAARAGGWLECQADQTLAGVARGRRCPPGPRDRLGGARAPRRDGPGERRPPVRRRGAAAEPQDGGRLPGRGVPDHELVRRRLGAPGVCDRAVAERARDL